MQRRSYLCGVATLGATSVAGCLGLADPNPDVVLSEPDRQFESSDVPYPAWGERIPDVTVSAPLENRRVTLRTLEKPRLLTFIYTHCPTVCPVLTSTMRNVQTHALNNGYGDRIEFLPATFDPARDTAGRLRRYAEKMNVDTDAGNWHFLRPRSKDAAKRIIQEQFGVVYRKQPTTSGGNERNGTETDDGHHHDHGGYKFVHTAMTLLVNADDYVERAYRTKSPSAERIITDLKEIRNA